MVVKYSYPVRKFCIICGSEYFAYNRFQARRNKVCSKRECINKLVGITQRGKKVSPESRGRISKALKNKKLAEDNPMWKGEAAGYFPIHKWVRRRLPEPKRCQSCGLKKPPLDLANISGEYKRDLNDWEYLCRKCHMKKDGRLEKFCEMGRGNFITKPVSQFTKTGEHIKDYPSLTIAAKELNIAKSCISAVLSGRVRTGKGFIWRYKNI